VHASFDFSEYSTRLDKDSEFYKENERYAALMSRSIARESARNVHVASDRGQDVGRFGLDAEEMHSTVLRGEDDGSGNVVAAVVVPPVAAAVNGALTSQQQRTQHAQQTQSTHVKPTTTTYVCVCCFVLFICLFRCFVMFVVVCLCVCVRSFVYDIQKKKKQ